uniref:Gnk2-homologous domain-containing protein n=1 Tax=Fagus sylvatica TaxID=28930 RepID=A0A2N9FDD3_FAGSY
MRYSSLVTIALGFLISLSLPSAQPPVCSNKGTFSTNSTYDKNLNLLLSSLPSNTTANGGFYNVTAGQDPNKVYTLALCRGDLDTTKCYNCVDKSSQDITKQCPNQKEAIIWGGSLYSKCTPDISQRDCRICLQGAVGDISSCCGGKEGGRVLRPSCIAWFELFRFYDSTLLANSPSLPSPPPTQAIPPTPTSTQAIPPTPTSDNSNSLTKTSKGMSDM